MFSRSALGPRFSRRGGSAAVSVSGPRFSRRWGILHSSCSAFISSTSTSWMPSSTTSAGSFMPSKGTQCDLARQPGNEVLEVLEFSISSSPCPSDRSVSVASVSSGSAASPQPEEHKSLPAPPKPESRQLRWGRARERGLAASRPAARTQTAPQPRPPTCASGAPRVEPPSSASRAPTTTKALGSRQRPDIRYYAVWWVRGGDGRRSSAAAGIHFGERAWKAVEQLIPGGRYVPSLAGLRRAPTLEAAEELYLGEAARHDAPTAIRYFRHD